MPFLEAILRIAYIDRFGDVCCAILHNTVTSAQSMASWAWSTGADLSQ